MEGETGASQRSAPNAPCHGVGTCALSWQVDELPGFEQATFELPPEDDGPLCATLVRCADSSLPSDAPAVLYVHGFVDYFFQTHMAEAFERAGLRFYALDLRRYGRSIRPNNRANQARDVRDYFLELDMAISAVRKTHGVVAGVVAHSTGGLICANYLAERPAETLTKCLVLNSPFLRFHLPRWAYLQVRAAERLAQVAPYTKLPQRFPPNYGMTLHKGYLGKWDYDLKKKPLRGFPLYAGWFRKIFSAHERVEAGLNIQLPILLLHSDHSKLPDKEVVPADFRSDIVLNVDDMKELAPCLGSRVSLHEVPGGVHDLVLSEPPAGDIALSRMIEFVQECQERKTKGA